MYENYINIISNNNHPNIIIYNKYNSKQLFYNIFNLIYKNYNLINETYKKINYKKSIYHYEFDIFKINSKNKNNFIEFITNIVKSKNYYSNNKKIIVLFNFQECNKKLQLFLKIILNKYYYIKFFICTSNYNKIILNIKSSCILFRISKNDINLYNSNILINTSNQYYIFINDIISYIYNLYISNLPYNLLINNIKNISYLLVCCNINFNEFIYLFINKLLSIPYLTNNVKYLLIKEISNIEYHRLFTYYKLIYYEWIIIKIYHIIKNCIKSIY